MNSHLPPYQKSQYTFFYFKLFDKLQGAPLCEKPEAQIALYQSFYQAASKRKIPASYSKCGFTEFIIMNPSARVSDTVTLTQRNAQQTNSKIVLISFLGNFFVR